MIIGPVLRAPCEEAFVLGEPIELGEEPVPPKFGFNLGKFLSAVSVFPFAALLGLIALPLHIF